MSSLLLYYVPLHIYNIILFCSLSELVKQDENGYVFSSEEELTTLLQTWFFEFPTNKSQQLIHEKFQRELHKFQEIRWHDNWLLHVLPCFS